MAVSLRRDKLAWPTEIWRDIDQAELDEADRIRIAHKAFPASTDGSGQNLPDETVECGDGAKVLIPVAARRPLQNGEGWRAACS